MIIVLDSGHGGEDPGKIGVNQAKEKDVNLKIAKKDQKRDWRKRDGKVVMTREKDVDAWRSGMQEIKRSMI